MEGLQLPEDNLNPELVEANPDVENLLTWKIECFNHIRWLENTNWKSMTLIGTITIAIIGFLAQYVFKSENESSSLVIMILGLVIAFNTIGVAILLRNRRGFLENLYQASVAEHILGEKSNCFELVMNLRPKNWKIVGNPAFRNAFCFGSVFLSMVTFHLFLSVVSYLAMSYLAFQNLDMKSLNTIGVFAGVLIIPVICMLIFRNLFVSYREWWKKQEWIEKFEKVMSSK